MHNPMTDRDQAIVFVVLAKEPDQMIDGAGMAEPCAIFPCALANGCSRRIFRDKSRCCMQPFDLAAQQQFLRIRLRLKYGKLNA